MQILFKMIQKTQKHDWWFFFSSLYSISDLTRHVSVFAFVNVYSFSYLFIYLYFASFTNTQQNVFHSNTNSSIGFDKSILFYFHKSSWLFITRRNLYTLFFSLVFSSIKAFHAIHLASRVSFCVGVVCKWRM